MSENNSRYAHSLCLCRMSAVLGVVSGTLLFIAGLDSFDTVDPSDEFRAGTRKIFISGAVFAASSLLAGVVACVPLSSFISEGIPYSQSDRVVLVENESQSVLLNNPDDQPPSYQSMVGNIPPPNYAPELGTNITGGNENISPPSYATAVRVSSTNTLPQSYESSVSVNRGIV